MPHSVAARPDRYCLRLAGLALGLFTLGVSPALAQPTFTPIPTLAGAPGGNTSAFIAGYGQYVVGDSDSASTTGLALEDGFRFDRFSLVPSSMSSLNSAAFSTHGTGICADGAISVGYSLQSITSGATTANRPRAFLWYGFGTPFSIGIAGAPPGDPGASYAHAISGDGGTVIGATTTAASSELQAFRWNGGYGFIALPALAGSGPSIARACSYNAQVIVGESAGQPFRWINSGGAGTTAAIPPVADARDASGAAWGANTGGNVVVGAITSPTFTDNSLGDPIPQPVAFRWSPAGTRSLGALASSGSQSSRALGVSGDGGIVVGDSRTSGTLAAGAVSEAFIWTPRWGVSRLADHLAGVLPAGVRLDAATGITYDGRIICGSGTTLNSGAPFAFVATLAYCPADQDDNGRLEIADIFRFINDWMAGLSRADIDANGSLEVQDIFAFLNAWFAGC